MRLLADQNVEHGVVARLRAAGHEVVELVAVLPAGAPDEEVFTLAESSGNVLITNDKGFGDFAFVQGRARAGIILMRMPALSGEEKGDRVYKAVEALGPRIEGAMVVVTELGVRRRPFPPARS